MGSSHKKVILRRFAGELLPGYLGMSGFVSQRDDVLESGGGAPVLHLLDLSGRVIPVAVAEVKMVSYVRDFNLADTVNPERLLRRTFLARPRGEGLWVRVTFRSGDVLEGLAPIDLTLADDLIGDHGLHLLPPDTRSNTQRIFVPRLAIATLDLLAVVTSPSRRRSAAVLASGEVVQQEELFGAVGHDDRKDAPRR